MKSERKNTAGAELSAADAMNDPRLTAARQRLAESSGQQDAIEALREIAGNFLGSEEIALFQIDRQLADARILWSFGIEPERCNLLDSLGEAGLRRVARGECHVELVSEGNADSASKAQAFVPIRVENHTVAVLAILRLLPQKAGFDKPDMALLQLLSNEAGKAVFPSELKKGAGSVQ